ncbi:hypothetical protein ACFLXI_02245 [Chloroflexota bacterium]
MIANVFSKKRSRFKKTGLVLKPEEIEAMEIADFGLGEVEISGAQIITLFETDQITFQPNTPHWFQGGPEGVMIWSFSSRVIDIKDIFTDPDIVR